MFDPFLLLDDFRNDVPGDYLAGFPWHPHRGIETITYVLAGTDGARRQHGQPRRHRRRRHPIDERAGGASFTRKYAKGDAEGRMHGFQLWANLPSAMKMTEPRYQEIKAAEIPLITDDDGTGVRIVPAEPSGASAARSTASPPIQCTST